MAETEVPVGVPGIEPGTPQETLLRALGLETLTERLRRVSPEQVKISARRRVAHYEGLKRLPEPGFPYDPESILDEPDPYTGYKMDLAKDSLNDIAERTIEKDEQGEVVPEEETARALEATRCLREIETRRVFFEVFFQRRKTCTDEGAASTIFLSPEHAILTTPKVEILANLPENKEGQEKLGVLIDRGLRQLARVLMEEAEDEEGKIHNIFVRPERFTATDFKRIVRFMADETKGTQGDLSAVCLALRLACVWELTTKFGLRWGRVEYKGQEVERPYFGDPSWTSDLLKEMHLEAKRSLEDGSVEGERKGVRVRFRGGRYSAGPEVTLGRYPDLITDYLHFAEVKDPEDPEKKVSLWELWWARGTPLAKLPWRKVEEEKEVVPETSEVISTYSFDGWLYQRWRAGNVYKAILATEVSIRFLEDSKGLGSWEKLVKDFDKCFGERKKGMKPMDDPRTWFCIGVIMDHHPSGYTWNVERGEIKRSGELPIAKRWTYLKSSEALSPDQYAASLLYFISGAENSGFITKGERKFIWDFCSLKSSFLGIYW